MFQNDFSLHVLNQETVLLRQLNVWKKPYSSAFSKSESLTIVVASTNDEIPLYFGWL